MVILHPPISFIGGYDIDCFSVFSICVLLAQHPRLLLLNTHVKVYFVGKAFSWVLLFLYCLTSMLFIAEFILFAFNIVTPLLYPHFTFRCHILNEVSVGLEEFPFISFLQ